MTTPTTAAGRALLEDWAVWDGVRVIDGILAIEAEAAAPLESRVAALEEALVKSVVDALMSEETGAGYYRWQYENIVRPAIRAALTPPAPAAPATGYHPDPDIDAEVRRDALDNERFDLAAGYPPRWWACPSCGASHQRWFIAEGQHRCLRCGYVGYVFSDGSLCDEGHDGILHRHIHDDEAVCAKYGPHPRPSCHPYPFQPAEPAPTAGEDAGWRDDDDERQNDWENAGMGEP